MNIDSASLAIRTPEASRLAAATREADMKQLGDKAIGTDQPQVELSRTAKLIAKNDAAATEETADGGTSASSASSIPVKEAQSFVYGALGLERPDEAPKSENTYYTAGKWLSAAATAGMLVSLMA